MSKYAFGVDVGGTTVKLGLFDGEGTLLDKWEIPTVTENQGEAILPDVAKSITAKMEAKGLAEADVAGIGIGVPGPVDRNGLLVGRAVNLGWDSLDIPGALSAYINVPVRAANDANVAAFGELWQGGGKGYENMVAVTLGTGVGGGIIVDGRLLAGSTARLGISISRTGRRSAATAGTAAVWSSTPPPRASCVWRSAAWGRMRRKASCAGERSAPRPCSMP